VVFFSKIFQNKNLVHFLDQIVDILFSVTEVTSLDKVVGDFSPASSWAGKFDWVQVVVDSLEVFADGVDFVDQIFDAVDTIFAHGFFDDVVVGDLDPLSVNLDGTSFVDHVLDGFLGWVSPSDEWITNSQHLEGGGVQSDENGVSDLSESKKLEGLLWFWGQLVDTSDSNDQSEFFFAWNIVVSVSFGGFGVVNQSFGFSGVFGSVGSGFGDDFSLFGQTGFFGDSFGFGLGGSLFSESGSFFGETFWNSGFCYFGDGHFRRNKFCLVFFCKFDLRL